MPDCPDGSIRIRNDLVPGDIGSIIHLHGKIYAEEYGFDNTFEPYVAGPLSDFVLNRTDRDRIWIAECELKVRGSIAIVRFSDTVAQLRWLILHPDIRGRGLGMRLVRDAVTFSRESAYESIFLWTVSHLKAATHLYKSMGFECTETRTEPNWGQMLTEERYDLIF
ncbi:MAG: GNAT family N-acetyltransferase [Desulfobacteraceae bacterium]|nr:GNAT family N-acetyltransferase [Desulfobacteraceae bacterium]